MKTSDDQSVNSILSVIFYFIGFWVASFIVDGWVDERKRSEEDM